MSSDTIVGRFFRSTAAATFSQFWRVGVTFLTAMLLRRFIAPGDWGLWTWSQPVFLVLGALRDLGLIYHVVRIKPRPYGNLLAVEAGWGSTLVLATVAAAPWLARAYTEPSPDVIPVLQALSLFVLFDGLASVPRVYFENELRIGRAVLPEIVRNLVFALTAITMAVLGHGIWSLVVAHVVSAAVYAAHLWLRAWGRIPLHWETGKTWTLIRESLPLALIWFLVILTRYIDPLLLGFHYHGHVIGNYGFAYFIAFLVSTVLVPPLARALYPALVAFDSESQAIEAYRLATLLILAAEVPAAMFLFVNTELVVNILGGSAWETAPGLLLILCWAPLVDPFSRLGGELLKTHGMDLTWILATLATLMSYIGFGLFLIHRLGPTGMAWANLLPLGGFIMAWAIRRIDPAAFRRLLRDLLTVYLIPLPAFLIVWLTLGNQPLPRFAASIVAALIAVGIYARRFGPAFRAFLKAPRQVALEATSDGTPA